MLKTTNDARFGADVLKSGVPALVMFSAPWAGPCNLARPRAESVAARYGNRMDFFEFSLDDNPATPEFYGVRGVPSFYLFMDGKPVEVVGGAVSQQRLEDMVGLAMEAL